MTDLKLELEKSIARFSRYRRKKAIEHTLSKAEREVEEAKHEAVVASLEIDENSNNISSRSVTNNNNVVVVLDGQSARTSTSGQSLSRRCKIQTISVCVVIAFIIALICILSR